MGEALGSALKGLPDHLAWHVVLSASALLLAAAISLPLAVWAARSSRVRWPVLAGAGLVQTIPSLALLALFYPLLLALSGLAQATVGRGFPALGFLPSLLALTLYGMLPMLRNGVAGLTGVDPAVVEAARGVGMTPTQRFLRVEAPLAAPVAMAGVRTAAVLTIGTATLATPVGQTSLGDDIFAGLQTENWALVLVGCVAAAALALVVDQLLGLIEHGLAKRSRVRVWAGAGLLLAAVLAATAPLALGAIKPRGYVVGAKNFSEQYILSDLMADRLRAAAAPVQVRSDLGSSIAFQALKSNEIDAYVDYSGTLWTNVLARRDNPPRAELLAQLSVELKRRYGVTVLGPLGFENAYAVAMKRAQAQRLGVASLADLSPRAPQLVFGADLEFLSRPEWAAIRDAYGLRFKAQKRFQPTFMYRALVDGGVDAISAFSSDGRIAADDLVTLSDPKNAAPSYDAVLLLAPKRAGDARLKAALRPLVGRIGIDAMRRANLSVDRDRDKASPAAAARELSRALGAAVGLRP